MSRWLNNPDDFKNRCFYQNSNGYCYYVFVQDRQSIIAPDETAFIYIILPPKEFQNVSLGFSDYKLKACFTYFDNDKKDWVVDEEILTFKINKKYHDWFTKYKCAAGDRWKIEGYTYQNPVTKKYMRSLNFRRAKKGNGRIE